MSDAAAYALALLRIDGLGAVSAHRVLDRLPSAEALEACPHEQLRIWLKGLPRADTLAASLKDEAAFGAHLEQARAELEPLQERGIQMLAPGDSRWPRALDTLEPAHRPVVLYAYGDLAALDRPLGAVLGRAPVPGPAYEIAQDAARALWAQGASLGVGAQPGFDVAFHRLAAHHGPAVLVAASGLARVPGPVRPSVSAALRGGGVLLSAFPMEHGPFEHDQVASARLLAALAHASLFVHPQPESPEARALEWATEHERPRFGTGPEHAGCIPIEQPRDLAWFTSAALGLEP